jgi:excisionase family DNA binding protein
MTTARRHRNQVRIRAAAVLDREPVGEEPLPAEVTTPTPPPPPAQKKTPLRQALYNPVLLPEEVAMLLRVSPETVLKLVKAGDLLSLKVDKEVRVMRVDLIKFMYELRDKPETLKRYKQSEIEEHAYSND